MRHVTVQQLSAFLDGALTGVSRDLVTRHLAACADCRERHALWHIYDEVLQRVLSWEPNEHTMEEASARVELTLTAERRGMPPPEFTSVLHPVIAGHPAGHPPKAGPGPPDPAAAARASGFFPPLPPITQAPTGHALPPGPAPANPPAPVRVQQQGPVPARAAAPDPPVVAPAHPANLPSALAFPLDPPGAAIAPPPPPPQYGVPPAHARYAPPQPAYSPPRPAPPPYVPTASAPAPGYTPPISVHEDLRSYPVPSSAQWPGGTEPQPSRKRRLLWLCAALLALVVLATPWLPDVIRVRIPESWGPRVPRVEFVRHGTQPAEPPAATDPTLRLAERTSSAPPPEPYRALPPSAESTAASPAPTVQDPAPAPADSAALQAPAVAPAPPVAAKTKPPSKPRKPPAPVKQVESEDESGTAAGAQHSMTFIPVQVKTEVRLSSTAPTSQPSQPVATTAAADSVGDRALPLLCGEVVDESGAPIEGVRVQFTSPPLTVRTDKRGRFCASLPAGERTFLVESPGFATVTRGVELDGPTFETRITLTAVH